MLRDESPLNIGPFTTVRRAGKKDAIVTRLYPSYRLDELFDWISRENSHLRPEKRIPMYIPTITVINLDSTNSLYATIEAIGDGVTSVSYALARGNTPLEDIDSFELPRRFAEQFYIPGSTSSKLKQWKDQFEVIPHAISQAPRGVVWADR